MTLDKVSHKLLNIFRNLITVIKGQFFREKKKEEKKKEVITYLFPKLSFLNRIHLTNTCLGKYKDFKD